MAGPANAQHLPKNTSAIFYKQLKYNEQKYQLWVNTWSYHVSGPPYVTDAISN